MSQSGSRTNVKSDCFYTVEVEFNDIEVYIPPTKHRKFLFGPPRSTKMKDQKPRRFLVFSFIHADFQALCFRGMQQNFMVRVHCLR